MSKKFFSLFHGESVSLAPKTKRIPADVISKALDVEGVLEEVKSSAERYRLEVAQEAEKLKQIAANEGYEEGFKQWGEHIANLELEIEKVRQEVTAMIIPIALKAAKKIVGREIELSNETIVDIVLNNLKAVSSHKKIKIYVNKADLEVLEGNKNVLKQVFENLESLSLIERNDVKPGGCIIETEGGIINAQLENQWRILEQAFSTLMKQQKT